MDMQEYLGLFLDESRENLQALNASILDLEREPDDPIEALNTIFRRDTRRLPTLCDVVCPNRLFARLALQALVLIGALSLSLWFLSCTVRDWNRRYLTFLWVGGGLTVFLALALLECAPALADVPPNLPLFAQLGLTAADFSPKPALAAWDRGPSDALVDRTGRPGPAVGAQLRRPDDR